MMIMSHQSYKTLNKSVTLCDLYNHKLWRQGKYSQEPFFSLPGPSYCCHCEKESILPEKKHKFCEVPPLSSNLK